MNVRHAEQEDAKKIHNVALKSWKNAYSHILSNNAIEEVINEWYSIESLKEDIEHPSFFIAEKNSEIVGFVHATQKEGIAQLHRIYVDPEYQRQGIGSSLYNKMESELPSKTEELHLEVLKQNKSGKQFYKKQGFQIATEEEIELKGETTKQLKMKKKI